MAAKQPQGIDYIDFGGNHFWIAGPADDCFVLEVYEN